MSLRKNLVKVVRTLLKQITQLSRDITKSVMNLLLRGFMVLGRQSRLAKAGFILPTVTMVTIVVVLLTTAILIRSFDRSKNAGNYRLNQTVLNAATPALDRAKAKLDALFEDPTLPRGTPSEISINDVLIRDKYKLADEIKLQVSYDIDGLGTINTRDNTPTLTISKEEAIKTAWRFPADTDNNGKFDSFTLYGIFFRTPDSTPIRARVPLEARTPPMSEGSGSNACAAAAGTSASLVGSNGWFKTGSQLKKSFFVYMTTVPITNLADLSLSNATYETYKGGTKGYSALEYQQDRGKIPLANNAVLYEDDVDIVSGTAFRLNGRIFTNSNLLVSKFSQPAELFQVSSRNSCFYEEENSKIVVGGNVAYGYANIASDADRTAATIGGKEVDVHLFQNTKPATSDPAIGQTLKAGNQSVTEFPAQLAYNTKAYTERIEFLVNRVIDRDNNLATDDNPQTIAGAYPNQIVTSTDPVEVKNRVQDLINQPTNPEDPKTARKEQLAIYFRNRTRRVPFLEVPYKSANNFIGKDVQGFGTESLRPPDVWMFPFAPTDGKTGANYSGLTLNGGTKLLPEATRFDEQEKSSKEQYIGDRVALGNNLPAFWYKDTQFVGAKTEQEITGTQWDSPAGASPRTRKSRVRALDNLNVIGRDKFWETESAKTPVNIIDGDGGLRVVTGAGVYLPNLMGETLAANASNVVWPDTMPVVTTDGLPIVPVPPITTPTTDPLDKNNKKRPYLRMRATAVYNYRFNNGTKPIACVSSYYDPTDKDTVRNLANLGAGTDVSSEVAGIASPLPSNLLPTKAKSNNGVTYNPSGKTYADYLTDLDYQARLVYPNGRVVNPLLKTVVAKNGLNLSLAEQAAVDSTICALDIYNNGNATSGLTASTTPNGYSLPHGTIKEIALLDARQIKSIENSYDPAALGTKPPVGSPAGTQPGAAGSSSLAGNYDLAIEQRQPLEIRATVIDLDNLRNNSAPAPGATNPDGTPLKEYMLPNSGIIYATRDDALPDASDSSSDVSATDFKLDPTRRPNGIMLINGKDLLRNQNYLEVEKGLILASDLPVYVKAQNNEFNTHKSGGAEIGEFTGTQPDTTTSASDFYSRSNLDPNFACRKLDPRLPNGACGTPDTWRSATILSDSVTLLSSSFREGVRTEGDYELRNNQIDNIVDPDTSNDTPTVTNEVDAAADVKQRRLQNGFWDNNFVTSRNFTDADYKGTTATVTNSSYFNNFVTPIQRRINSPEYLMEICRKLPVSECNAKDWVLGYDVNGNGNLNDSEATLNAAFPGINLDGDPATSNTVFERDVKVNQLGRILATVTANGGAGRIDTNTDSILSNAETNWSTPYVAGGGASKSPIERLGAGTTAKPALVVAEQRFARRVAFSRTKFDSLTNTMIAVAPAINPTGFNPATEPLGIGCPLDAIGTTPENNGCQYPAPAVALVAGTHYGNVTQNNLWFRSTDDTNGQAWKNSNNSWFLGNRPLSYLAPNNGRENLLLPDVVPIPGATAASDALNGPTPTATPPIDYDDPSDYAACINTVGQSQSYAVNTIAGTCPPAVISQVKTARNTLASLTPVATPMTGVAQELTASQVTNPNIYKFPNNSTITGQITLNGNRDSIFVFQADPAARMTFSGVALVLNGVDPNNIYWVSNTDADVAKGGMTFTGNNQLAGNFLGGNIGNSDTLTINPNTQIWAGRLLGFTGSNFTGGAVPANVTIKAIASQNQPLLSPVLQLQYLTADDINAASLSPTLVAPPPNKIKSTQWLPRAAGNTTFNMVMATGDNPSRPPNAAVTGDIGDFNGGIANLPHFLENWNAADGTTSTTTKIYGSFIQIKRSAYATAPFWQLNNTNIITGTGGLFGYIQSYTTGSSATPPQGGKSPSYEAPGRNWGFDVGLLSQLPDLFSKQFTVTPAGTPNEYFREVSRDDDWIKTLLCATKQTGGTPAINTDQRPTSFCADKAKT